MSTTTPVAEHLDVLFAGRSTAVAKDTKLNLRRVLSEGSLSPQEASAAFLALAHSLSHEGFGAYAEGWMAGLEAPEGLATADWIRDVREAAAVTKMLNTYYKFRGFIEDGRALDGASDDYGAAGLRMTALARPAMGKVPFEMIAFAVSVLNACPKCVIAHEKVLKEHGVAQDKLHDLARMAAVVASAEQVLAV